MYRNSHSANARALEEGTIAIGLSDPSVQGHEGKNQVWSPLSWLLIIVFAVSAAQCTSIEYHRSMSLVSHVHKSIRFLHRSTSLEMQCLRARERS